MWAVQVGGAGSRDAVPPCRPGRAAAGRVQVFRAGWKSPPAVIRRSRRAARERSGRCRRSADPVW